ncbi:hypothetical protein GCM10029992_26840 [Glycomyces albus]
MSTWRLRPEIQEYYERGGERDRLTKSGRGRLEFTRMQDILRRVLPERNSTSSTSAGRPASTPPGSPRTATA